MASGFLTVPGHPQSGIGAGSAFTLGETNLAEVRTASGLVGSFVTLTSEATDDVGNKSTDSFEVLYDWTAPDLKITSMGGSVLLADGTYRSTERFIDIRLTGGEGEFVEWTASQPGPRLMGGIAELVIGLPGVYSASVRLMDGLNIISFRTEDPVGNQATTSVVVERVFDLVSGTDTRQIELIARGAGVVDVSDDGSTFVFDFKQTGVIEGDTNGEGDVFASRNGVVTRASTNATGDQPVGGESRKPVVSGDGRYVYFLSEATNLVSQTTSGFNFYVKNLLEGNIALVSKDASAEIRRCRH